MKVLKSGTPFTVEVVCTGQRNGGGGCNALLEVVEDDLFITFTVNNDPEPTVRCPDCQCLTWVEDVPSQIERRLPDATVWAMRHGLRWTRDGFTLAPAVGE